MLLDFKYHIFTISAIFGALGLGILIGTSIIGQEGLIKEQNRLIENISKDIKNIKKENLNLMADINQLHEELDYRKKMEKNIVSLFLKDVMKNQKILLYTEKDNKNNETSQQIAAIKDVFQNAGASLQVIKDYQQLKQSQEIDEITDINPEQFKQIIFWDTPSLKEDIQKELKNSFGDKILFSQKSDMLGLLLKIVEIIDNSEQRIMKEKKIMEEENNE